MFILFLVAFIVTLIVGNKVIKAFKKKPTVPVEEGGVPTVETEVVKEPIKAIKVAGVRIDIQGSKEKCINFCKGLKDLIQIER